MTEEMHHPNTKGIESLIEENQKSKSDTTNRLDRLEILLERLCRQNHVRIPYPRSDNKVPWE